MLSDCDNPYAAPAAELRKQTRLKPWAKLAAAASFIIGCISFGVGVIAVAIMSYVLWNERTDPHQTVGMMLAGCSLYLGFGVAWIFAGWCYWKERFLHGLIATAVGALIPVALFSILGF